MPAKAIATGSALQRQSCALASDEARFAEVLALIEAARNRAYQAVNTELVTLYWQLGEHISQKLAKAEWGDGVVDDLAATLARRYPGMRGYTRANLFRMRQFYEAYHRNEKVSPLVRQLPWTHHLIILSQAKPPAAREFYMLAAIKERWTKRELERQIQSAAILRSNAAAKKVSPAVAQIHPTAIDELKNAYSLEFLSIQEGHGSRSPRRPAAQPRPLYHRAGSRLIVGGSLQAHCSLCNDRCTIARSGCFIILAFKSYAPPENPRTNRALRSDNLLDITNHDQEPHEGCALQERAGFQSSTTHPETSS